MTFPPIPGTGLEIAVLVLIVFFLMVKIILDLVKQKGQNELISVLTEETKQLHVALTDLKSAMSVQNVLLDKIFQKVVK